jgi:hypothetical protein
MQQKGGYASAIRRTMLGAESNAFNCTQRMTAWAREYEQKESVQRQCAAYSNELSDKDVVSLESSTWIVMHTRRSCAMKLA